MVNKIKGMNIHSLGLGTPGVVGHLLGWCILSAPVNSVEKAFSLNVN